MSDRRWRSATRAIVAAQRFSLLGRRRHLDTGALHAVKLANARKKLAMATSLIIEQNGCNSAAHDATDGLILGALAPDVLLMVGAYLDATLDKASDEQEAAALAMLQGLGF
jgi:hypothetical protein